MQPNKIIREQAQSITLPPSILSLSGHTTNGTPEDLVQRVELDTKGRQPVSWNTLRNAITQVSPTNDQLLVIRTYLQSGLDVVKNGHLGRDYRDSMAYVDKHLDLYAQKC